MQVSPRDGISALRGRGSRKVSRPLPVPFAFSLSLPLSLCLSLPLCVSLPLSLSPSLCVSLSPSLPRDPDAREAPAGLPGPPTLVQTPVVASQRVRMDTFCARLSQFTATLVLVAHLTMVM